MVRLGHTTRATEGKRVSLGTLPRLQKDQASSNRHDHRLAAAGGHLEAQTGQGGELLVGGQIPESLNMLVGELRPEAGRATAQPDFVEERSPSRRLPTGRRRAGGDGRSATSSAEAPL